jgi:hypothetical protein
MGIADEPGMPIMLPMFICICMEEGGVGPIAIISWLRKDATSECRRAQSRQSNEGRSSYRSQWVHWYVAGFIPQLRHTMLFGLYARMFLMVVVVVVFCFYFFVFFSFFPMR